MSDIDLSRAACREPGVDAEWFFGADHPGRPPANDQRQKRAKAVCRRCPIRPDCLALALERDEEFGVWGGKDPKERRALKQRRSYRPQDEIARLSREALRLRAEGTTWPQIARTLGVHEQAARYYVQRALDHARQVAA